MVDISKYTYSVSAAGRVNVIGEHIDYCGGKVMPSALSLRNTIYVCPNGTDKINLSWTTLPNEVTLDINKLESYKKLKYGNYQAGSALMWKRAGHKLVGCDMLYDCTVPFGSGLSSSAAIEVSTIAALATMAGEQFDNVEVALCAQQAEREYAGVNCGIMDQYASACGKKDSVMLLDCKTLKCEYIPCKLGDYSLVIIDCNKPHNLVESKYNERRQQTEQALELLQQKVKADCLADITPEQYKSICGILPPEIEKRARHVIEECARVESAKDKLIGGDIVGLGKILNASHASLRDLYEVTGRELDVLAELAQNHPACVGSRMTGGGFGGCTISLVKSDMVQDFKTQVLTEYRKATGYKAMCYDAQISDGIIVKKLL